MFLNLARCNSVFVYDFASQIKKPALSTLVFFSQMNILNLAVDIIMLGFTNCQEGQK